tara:strand:+ start:164 stop:496 length:333 start_codon:yes stop_codon:yes gene_type:complete
MHNNITVIDQAVGRLQVQMEELTARMDAMQGNRRTLFLSTGITDNAVPKVPDGFWNPDYIPVDDDGVWQTSATTMNLLYAMYLWANEHGIDNEDDWENHLELHNLQGAKK